MPDGYDWVDDDTLSAEETMRIFEGLGPEVTLTPAEAHYLRDEEIRRHIEAARESIRRGEAKPRKRLPR